MSQSAGLSTGGMAGIGVVVLIALIALLVGAVFYYRRKYKHEKANVSERKAGSFVFLTIIFTVEH